MSSANHVCKNYVCNNIICNNSYEPDNCPKCGTAMDCHFEEEMYDEGNYNEED